MASEECGQWDCAVIKEVVFSSESDKWYIVIEK